MAFKTLNPLIDKMSNENVFDGDYRRSWGDSEAIKKIQEFLRSNPTKADVKFIKALFPEADDDLINNALDQVEIVNTGEEKKLRDATFQKVNSKLPF